MKIQKDDLRLFFVLFSMFAVIFCALPLSHTGFVAVTDAVYSDTVEKFNQSVESMNSRSKAGKSSVWSIRYVPDRQVWSVVIKEPTRMNRIEFSENPNLKIGQEYLVQN